jgi:hypothetical protein
MSRHEIPASEKKQSTGSNLLIRYIVISVQAVAQTYSFPDYGREIAISRLELNNCSRIVHRLQELRGDILKKVVCLVESRIGDGLTREEAVDWASGEGFTEMETANLDMASLHTYLSNHGPLYCAGFYQKGFAAEHCIVVVGVLQRIMSGAEINRFFRESYYRGDSVQVRGKRDWVIYNDPQPPGRCKVMWHNHFESEFFLGDFREEPGLMMYYQRQV